MLIKASDEGGAADITGGGREILESPSRKKFCVFISNRTDWDASTILSFYTLRWTIETSFEDMSQHLSLHGCKWRELSGQACFLALTYLCYQFLAWAQVHGGLCRYGVERGTLGQAREAFAGYCQEQFSEWLADIKQQCGTCGPANWMYDHAFRGGKED